MSRERGATLVETSLALSLLFMVLLGIIEVGRYVTIWHGANTAAREGARYGIAVGDSANTIPRYTDCSEIVDAAIDLSGLARLTPGDISVTYVDGGGNLQHDCAGGNPSSGDIGEGDRVVVTVSVPFEPITPMVGPIFGSSTIEATDSRTIFLESSP